MTGMELQYFVGYVDIVSGACKDNPHHQLPTNEFSSRENSKPWPVMLSLLGTH